MALGSCIGLPSDRVADLWAAVRDVAAHHVAEVSGLAGEYLGDRDGVEQVSAAELASGWPAARWCSAGRAPAR